MARYRSHPSPPWPGARKPRAVAPSTVAEYNLLASTVACRRLPPESISRLAGFEPDRAERLVRSALGAAFCTWRRRQPAEFVGGFRLGADVAPQLAPMPSADDVLAELGYSPRKRRR